MSAFDFRTLRIVVERAQEEGTWRVAVEAPGVRPVGLMTFGGESEERVALDMIRDLRKIFTMGVEPYLEMLAEQNPEIDLAAERRRASMMFAVAQAADDKDLEEAERRLFEEAATPEEREAIEAADLMRRMLSRTFDFGNVRLSVSPHKMTETGQVWFYILMEAPGIKDEDLMMRPPGYLVSNVAADHIKVIRAVLENGVPASVERHLRSNYLGPELRPQAEEYIRRLDQVGRALGDAELARVQVELEEEAGREGEERAGLTEQYKERAEAGALADLEERDRALEERIREIREKRAGRRRPGT